MKTKSSEHTERRAGAGMSSAYITFLIELIVSSLNLRGTLIVYEAKIEHTDFWKRNEKFASYTLQTTVEATIIERYNIICTE